MARIFSGDVDKIAGLEKKMINAYMMYKKCRKIGRIGLAYMYMNTFCGLNKQRKQWLLLVGDIK